MNEGAPAAASSTCRSVRAEEIAIARQSRRSRLLDSTSRESDASLRGLPSSFSELARAFQAQRKAVADPSRRAAIEPAKIAIVLGDAMALMAGKKMVARAAAKVR